MSLGKYLSIASVTAGLAHGFCDAQDISIKDGLENALTFAPAILGGIKSAIPVGFLGAAAGSGKGIEGVLITGTTSAIVAGGVGFAYRGIQTAVGYGLGYTIGAITR